MSTQFAVAPTAPGSLGEDVAPAALLAYLDALGTWRDRRHAELDVLDEAALHAPDRDALTADVLLSMTLWKAVSGRHDLLVATWDSGRVGESERRRITTLIWGGLEGAAGAGATGGRDSALAVSLPEACRLSDSLAASLRSRLRLEGSEPDIEARVRDLRAQVERIRDQLELIPSAAREGARAVHASLAARVADLAERAQRGADVGGSLPVVESDAARAERDLIVGAAKRAQARQGAVRATALRADLDARAHAIARLAARAVAEVSPAPRLAVPDPDALGEVPTDPDGVRDYLARLDRVGQALDQCQAAYSGALERRDELAGQVEAYAAASGALPDPELVDDLSDLRGRAEAALARAPTNLTRLAALAAAQQAYLAAARATSAPRVADGLGEVQP